MKDTSLSIFSILEEKKNALIESGAPVTNLSIGTPDFLPDDHVVNAIAQAAAVREHYKYSLSEIPPLTDAVIAWYERRFGVALRPKEIMSVYGSQEGIAHVMFPFLGRGDGCICPNPGYPIFSYSVGLAGGEVIDVSLKEENGYLIDFDAISPAEAHRAKIIVASYPANPVTAVADAGFYERLVHFAKKYDLFVIHDNAYSDLILEGEPGISFLSVPAAKDVGIEFNSLSKTYNLTGARISFALGNEGMIERFRALRSQIDYGTFLPIQLGAIAALTGPQDIVRRNREGYRSRSRALCGGLRSIGWDVPDSKATMFVWAKIPAHFSSSVEFVMQLIDRAGVVCVPGVSFGTEGEGYVRLALVADEDDMVRAVDRIYQSGIVRG